MGGLRLRWLAAAANVSCVVDIRVFLIKGRLRYRSRCGKNLTCTAARCGTADVRLWHETDMPKYLGDVRYWVNSGKHLLSLSFSGFDPSLTSRRSDDQLGLTQFFRRWCDEFLTPESPCSPSSARTPQTARSAPAET